MTKTPFKLRSSGPFKMMGSSPAKAGPESTKPTGDEIAQQEFEDREYAIEYAINDNDLPEGKIPTEKQINKALKYIRTERKAGY